MNVFEQKNAESSSAPEIIIVGQGSSVVHSSVASFRRFGNSKERGRNRARASCSFFGREFQA
jgi:hypothetical protein